MGCLVPPASGGIPNASRAATVLAQLAPFALDSQAPRLGWCRRTGQLLSAPLPQPEAGASAACAALFPG